MIPPIPGPGEPLEQPGAPDYHLPYQAALNEAGTWQPAPNYHEPGAGGEPPNNPGRARSARIAVTAGVLAAAVVVGAGLALIIGQEPKPVADGSPSPTIEHASPSTSPSPRPSSTRSRRPSPSPSLSPSPSPSPVAFKEEREDLTAYERATMGGLKQGDCVAEDLDTISDGAKAPTVPCDQPHLTQVLGFVDLTGLEDGPFGFSGESQVIGLCGAFMKSFDLQPPIYSSLISASLPSEEEWDAGSRIMLVWVGAHGEMWTGSALDYSAALVK